MANLAKAIGRRAASFYGTGRFSTAERLAKHKVKYAGARKALAGKLKKLRKLAGPYGVKKSAVAIKAKRLQSREVLYRRTARAAVKKHGIHRSMVRDPGKAVYLKGKRYLRSLPSI